MKIAMTGATGFLGGEVLAQALAGGAYVTALARRAQPPQERLQWVQGSLEDRDALDRMVGDADAVIHVAGVVNAPDRAGFEAGNGHGTLAVIEAMRRCGTRRLVHVSSLAAREPDLSDYGWSKALAEQHVMASGLDWTIVRPPTIYGPGNHEMLDMFRLAERGIMLLPPGDRLSVIEVGDLARLLLTLAADRHASLAQCYEVDDGQPGGWTHATFAQAIGQALGRRVRTFAMPLWLLHLGVKIDRALRSDKAQLTTDRVRFMCHPDWVADPTAGVPRTLWAAQVETQEGLRTTAAAYRAKGWL